MKVFTIVSICVIGVIVIVLAAFVFIQQSKIQELETTISKQDISLTKLWKLASQDSVTLDQQTHMLQSEISQEYMERAQAIKELKTSVTEIANSVSEVRSTYTQPTYEQNQGIADAYNAAMEAQDIIQSQQR